MEYHLTSVRLLTDEKKMLEQIADKYNRSANGTLRLLVRAAYETLVENPDERSAEKTDTAV